MQKYQISNNLKLIKLNDLLQSNSNNIVVVFRIQIWVLNLYFE